MTETIDNAKVQTHKTADNIQEIQVTKCVDCRGENCPIPLLETRRAVIKGRKGDVIRVNNRDIFSERILDGLNAGCHYS